MVGPSEKVRSDELPERALLDGEAFVPSSAHEDLVGWDPRPRRRSVYRRSGVATLDFDQDEWMVRIPVIADQYPSSGTMMVQKPDCAVTWVPGR